jgi:hypothetical protein
MSTYKALIFLACPARLKWATCGFEEPTSMKFSVLPYFRRETKGFLAAFVILLGNWTPQFFTFRLTGRWKFAILKKKFLTYYFLGTTSV